MGDYRAIERKTEAGMFLESFLNNLTNEEITFGFEHLVALLEEVAEEVDSEAEALEDLVVDLKTQLKEAKDTILLLEEANTDLQDQLDEAFEEANQ